MAFAFMKVPLLAFMSNFVLQVVIFHPIVCQFTVTMCGMLSLSWAHQDPFCIHGDMQAELTSTHIKVEVHIRTRHHTLEGMHGEAFGVAF